MIYPVAVYGHTVLRKKAIPVKKDFPDLDVLVNNLFETMHSSDGVGLAAPQVGLSQRIIVVDASPFAEDEPALENFRKVFINPVIEKRFGDVVTFNEGCLSIPNIREDVNRPEKIKISYFDPEFKRYSETYEGIAARIIQHEYDHLDGILFTDLVSPLRKKIIAKKLIAISKGKFEVSYKTILPNQRVLQRQK
ncbi:MAG: peptide deformylase [Chlorobi bacterium]|nr:peptide deformylase [Chlorobiota bacterium]